MSLTEQRHPHRRARLAELHLDIERHLERAVAQRRRELA